MMDPNAWPALSFNEIILRSIHFSKKSNYQLFKRGLVCKSWFACQLVLKLALTTPIINKNKAGNQLIFSEFTHREDLGVILFLEICTFCVLLSSNFQSFHLLCHKNIIPPKIRPNHRIPFMMEIKVVKRAGFQRCEMRSQSIVL